MLGKARAAAAVVAALSLGVVAAPASAGTIDAQQLLRGNGAGAIGTQVGYSWAQTVTPLKSGGLDQVDLPLYRNDDETTGPLTVEIRDAPGGVPGSIVLASASVPAAAIPTAADTPLPVPYVAVPFGSPAPVLADTQYAIVTHAGTADSFLWWHGPGNVYVGGRALFSWNPNPTWNPFTIEDFVFKTYVTETYDFTGFFSPVNNPTDPEDSNSVKAGASVPVKFSLGGDQGLDVVAEDYPKLVLTQCASGLPDPIEETSTANNGLTYDALTHTYTYVWKTVKSWKGKCGTFTLKLEDGTEHTADFVFK